MPKKNKVFIEEKQNYIYDNFNIVIISSLGNNFYKFFCKNCNSYFNLFHKKVYDRIKKNKTPCSICNPYNKIDKKKKLYKENLSKLNIDLVDYIEKKGWVINCNVHGKVELFDIFGEKIFERIKNITNPCDKCYPYDNGKKIYNKYKNYFNNHNIKYINSEGNAEHKLYCKKCKSGFTINYKDLIGRINNNISPCLTCFPLDIEGKIIKKYGEYFNIHNIIYLNNINKVLHRIKCKKCNNIQDVKVDFLYDRKLYNITPCLDCLPIGEKKRSGVEKLLVDFLSEVYNGKIETSNRKILGDGKEIDIFFPDENKGVEINGLFWHGDKMYSVYPSYHYNKTKRAKENGVSLYHFFEDEVLKAMYFLFNNLKYIKNKSDINIDDINKRYNLKISKLPIKIGARNLNIKNIDKKEAQNFLSEYHIQGSDKADIYIGGYYKGNLISVISLKTKDITKNIKGHKNELELSRYGVIGGVNIIGGFKKLLNYFIKNHKNINKIYTYSDLRFSDPNNNVYLKGGFEKVKYVGVDYYYIDKGVRKHRFSYRKSILYNLCKRNNIKIGSYNYETEDSLYNKYRNYFNLYRIYGCGNIKWKMEIK